MIKVAEDWPQESRKHLDGELTFINYRNQIIYIFLI